MEKKPTLLQHTLMYGAILGVVSIIYSLVMYIAGIMPVSFGRIIMTMLIGLIISIIFVSMGMKSYRDKSLNGNITYGQAFVVGLLIILFSSIISSLYNLIFTTVIDPEYMTRVMEASKNWTYDWMSSRGLPDAQIEDAMDRLDRQAAEMSPVKTLWQGIIWPVIIGSILSLIVAAFVKKTKNPVL